MERSRIIRHHALNDVVARAIQSAGIPVTKEPMGLTRLKVKRPLHWYPYKEAEFYLGRHRDEHTGNFKFVSYSVCRRCIDLTARWNIQALPTRTRTLSSLLQLNPMSHSVQLLSHFWALRANAWSWFPAYLFQRLGHHTVFQFGTVIYRVSFYRQRTGPLAIPTLDFSLF